MEEIDYKDFQKLDIRIGTVVAAEVPTWSHWVMKLTVDLGKEVGERTIFAGIMKFYKPEDLIDKQFPFLINIKPKKIGSEGDYSQGMMLAADARVIENDEESKPVLFKLQEKVANGTRIR